MNETLMIPKKVTKGEDLMVIRRGEYERLVHGFSQAKDVLAKILQGEKELKQGKTRVVHSLAQLRG